MDAFVQAVEGSAINLWVIGSAWVWPILEILHFMGLSLLLGSLLIIDLRMAGFFRQINIAATHRLLPWTFIGFGINLVTGFLFLMGDPARYTANIGFWWKMILIGVAGLNALWFWVRINPEMKTWEPQALAPPVARAMAWISLGAWFGVLLLGRLIPYIGTG